MIKIAIEGPPASPISAVVSVLRRITASAPSIIDDVRPDLCPELGRVILEHMATDRHNAGTLNVGGWKSGACFGWDEPCMRELEAEIASSLAMRPHGWAMVNGDGSRHPRHQHQNAELSGLYYVQGDAGDPTVFETPTGEVAIVPRPGRLVLFPGDMWHRVDPVRGIPQRITIAFDVRK